MPNKTSEIRASSLIPLLAAIPSLALFVLWIADEGGYSAVDWYPGLLVLAGFLLASVIGLGRGGIRLSRAAAVAIGALAAYTAWSYASVLWADAQATALEGSERTLLYLLAFALFAILPWTSRAALIALALFVVAVAGIGVATLVDLGTGAEPVGLFIDARLSSPVGYMNANAAMWSMAALPALALSTRRELPALLRALFLSSCGLLVQLSILGQSRGWVFAMPVILIVAVALMPSRLRLVAPVLVVAVAGWLAAPELLDVYEAGGSLSRADAAPLIEAEAPDAARAVALSSVGLLLAGFALALLDRRVRMPRLPRRAARLGAVAAAVLVVAGATAGTLAATGGDPGGRLDRAWDDFRTTGETATAAEADNRFGRLGSTRYDFWRVAVELTGDNPVRGIGQDNYAAPYLLARETFQEPRWVHSLPLRLTTHTGFVGLALFLAFLVATAMAALRGARRAPPLSRALTAAALLPLVVWAIHGSVDWLWEFPGLSAPAFALAGLATALTGRARHAGSNTGEEATTPGRAWLRPAWIGGLVALTLAGLLASSRLYLAERDVREASELAGSDPATAFDRLDRAASLNRLNPRPDLIGSIIALDAGLPRAAAARLERALEREPGQWFPHFQLGLIESGTGDRRAARRRLVAARRLNPREPLIREALDRLGTRKPMTAREARMELLLRARRRVTAAE